MSLGLAIQPASSSFSLWGGSRVGNALGCVAPSPPQPGPQIIHIEGGEQGDNYNQPHGHGDVHIHNNKREPESWSESESETDIHTGDKTSKKKKKDNIEEVSAPTATTVTLDDVRRARDLYRQGKIPIEAYNDVKSKYLQGGGAMVFLLI